MSIAEYVGTDGVAVRVTPANPLPTSGGGGGGGGGDASAANQVTQITALGSLTETAPVSDTASSGLNGRLQRIAQRLTSLIALLPASLGIKTAAGSLSFALASDGTLPLPTGAATAAKQPALGTAGAASTDVITVQGIASGTAQPVSGPQTSAEFLANLRSGTATFTSVNSAATSGNILASNANRKGAVIVNTDANILYLDDSGGTASATRYTSALATGDEREVPFGYTGLITGVWAADGAGAALVVEYT